MLKKVKKIFYFLITLIFFMFIIFYYLSDENINKVNSNRENISLKLKDQNDDVPLLKNDTENIIDYNFTNLEKNNIKKRYFWELLKRD
tara:strand:+ start:281 stop:544 length:264 start_codon:yes stop_codon:yes gene_type:complete